MAPGQARVQNLGPAAQIRRVHCHFVSFWHSDFEVTFFQIQSSRLEAGVDVLGCKALCLEDVMDIRQVAPEERRKRCFCVVKMRMRVR